MIPRVTVSLAKGVSRHQKDTSEWRNKSISQVACIANNTGNHRVVESNANKG
jgi:hypothetical protein